MSKHCSARSRDMAVLMSDGAGDPDVYDDAYEQAGQIVEDIINNYGPDGLTVDALVKALRDVASMAENDERLRG